MIYLEIYEMELHLGDGIAFRLTDFIHENEELGFDCSMHHFGVH